MTDRWRSSVANTESSWDEFEERWWWFRRSCIISLGVRWAKKRFRYDKMQSVQLRVWGVNKRVYKHFSCAPPSYGSIYQRTVISTSYGNHTLIHTSPQSTRTATLAISANEVLDGMSFHTCSTAGTAQEFSVYHFAQNTMELAKAQLFPNIHHVWQRTPRTTTLSVCWIHLLRSSEYDNVYSTCAKWISRESNYFRNEQLPSGTLDFWESYSWTWWPMNALIFCNMDVKRVMFVSRMTLGRQQHSSLITG